jgi:putative redox protein
VASKPPTIADLEWRGDLTFSAASGAVSVVIDGHSAAGPSPVQALAIALAGCMSTDVVDIIAKGRHSLRALRSHVVGHRAQENPHRFTRVELHFTVEGAVPAAAVERAIALSRDKYCSVWHSMRQDIELVVTFDVLA